VPQLYFWHARSALIFAIVGATSLLTNGDSSKFSVATIDIYRVTVGFESDRSSVTAEMSRAVRKIIKAVKVRNLRRWGFVQPFFGSRRVCVIDKHKKKPVVGQKNKRPLRQTLQERRADQLVYLKKFTFQASVKLNDFLSGPA
jgi:hypothetical protein